MTFALFRLARKEALERRPEIFHKMGEPSSAERGQVLFDGPSHSQNHTGASGTFSTLGIVPGQQGYLPGFRHSSCSSANLACRQTTTDSTLPSPCVSQEYMDAGSPPNLQLDNGGSCQPSVDDFIRAADLMGDYLTWDMYGLAEPLPPWDQFGWTDQPSE